MLENRNWGPSNALGNCYREGMLPTDPIYLDHNATTPLSPAAREAMVRVWTQITGNPASPHAAGRKARSFLEAARENIIEQLGGITTGMAADRLLFTSGGTESNHLALLGLAGKSPGKVVISAIEHPSVNGAAEELAEKGFQIVRWPVTAAGVVDLAAADDILTDDVRLVSIMLANNETGVLQPVSQIAQICRKRIPHAILHSDAVQAIGKVPVNFRELNIDALTVTPHKFHGPVGIGGLLFRHNLEIHPTLRGGFQQAGLRPGTEPVALAVGFQTALAAACQAIETRQAQLQQLRDALEAKLLDGFPTAVINGAAAPRLPHTINIAFPGVNRQALVMALDLAGVACSTGSACASGSSEPSPVLIAMGLADDVVASSLRLSLGALTTAAEVAEAAERILKDANRLRQTK